MQFPRQPVFSSSADRAVSQRCRSARTGEQQRDRGERGRTATYQKKTQLKNNLGMRRKSVFTFNYISHDACRLRSILGEHGTVRCFDFVCVSLTLIHTQRCFSHTNPVSHMSHVSSTVRKKHLETTSLFSRADTEPSERRQTNDSVGKSHSSSVTVTSGSRVCATHLLLVCTFFFPHINNVTGGDKLNIQLKLCCYRREDYPSERVQLSSWSQWNIHFF